MEYLGSSTQQRCIGIASDHGGFELKETLSLALKDDGYDLVDFGAKQVIYTRSSLSSTIFPQEVLQSFLLPFS